MTPTLVDRLFDREEGPLLRDVLGRPGDEAARTRYAAWLRERGDARGDLLDLEARLEADDTAGDRARFAALLTRVDDEWWQAVRRHRWTLNCGAAAFEPPAVRFATACPRAWETLAPTSRPGVRACDDCHQPVYRCDTRAEAERHALAGHCIAVPAALAATVTDDVAGLVLGRPYVPELWARRLFP